MEDVALVAGTQQNLSNLYSFDIYDTDWLMAHTAWLICLIRTLIGRNTKDRKKLKMRR